ncbi:hypothetical protein [Fulvimonas soli]|uniref:Uncharacterized protein n=1 Tax=Fulvimonas soli TaxID=155197 RepID=A0A316IBP6_9GAMM|nr:hypothetical protein [Fulvimonas soli]PWK87775.1 hypothetical protein C7456_106268 [Fulvimonas soli]TNY26513.1 hypothetical protein BV497_08195 [Fulvimonas soli]
MSDVIDFLERMGQDAQLRDASPEEMAQAMEEAGLEPAVRSAILDGRAGRLQDLLGQGAHFSILMPGEEEEEEEQEDEDEEREQEGDEQLAASHGIRASAA